MNSSDYSHLEEKSWLAPTTVQPISGTIHLSGSKSLTNRELVLSALASTPSTLIAPLDSRDSQLMIQALRNLGTQITRDERGNLSIIPATTDMTVQTVIDCGLAGTVMRFVPPLAATFRGEITFDGDEAARKRPIQTTIDSLRKLGVNISGDGLPFTIQGLGEVEGGDLEIDASASSQFVSGLLLAAPKFSQGLRLKHSGKDLPSEPHIEMTLACLRARGVKAYASSPTSWVVEPGAINGAQILIEPDLSNAGPFLAAALVTKGKVVIKNWPLETTQVGKNLVGILQQMGATISFADGDLICQGGDSILGIDIDMHDSGELAPTIVALAALADSESRITGIAHLRGHETDRISALVTEINKLGGKATELADGIQIKPTVLTCGLWNSYGDHRMATAAAIIGLRVSGITISDINVVSKTMPEFVSLWGQLL